MTNKGGLEGIVVADTELSEVDGIRGRLLISGHSVEEVARSGFESSCGLLWDGVLPGSERRAEISSALGLARRHAWTMMDELGGALSMDDAMAALRASLSHLSSSRDGSTHDGYRLAGATAVFAAAWARMAAGYPPIEPHPRRDHAGDYLRMLRGSPGSAAEDKAMSAYLATVSEHGMNASTFAARTVASTEADTVSAIVAGIGALKGRLHGGAPGPVLDMMDAIGEPARAESWLRAELAEGRRIMGMGHRVYRARDPRAAVLEGVLRELSATRGAPSGENGAGDRCSRRVALARAVEVAAERLLAELKPGRPLRANVEFYTAVLLEALQVPRSLFTATFAVARVAGWVAHVSEQRRTGRLIRPRARYVGVRPTA